MEVSQNTYFIHKVNKEKKQQKWKVTIEHLHNLKKIINKQNLKNTLDRFKTLTCREKLKP